MTKEAILFILQQIPAPELNQNLVSADLVRDIDVKDPHQPIITLQTVNPALSAKKKLETQVYTAIRIAFPTAEPIIHITHLTTAEKQPIHRKILPQVKQIIAIASGKGGVGKSTLTASLAITAQLNGKKVGLIDADIYGPSIPLLFDLEGKRPEGVEKAGKTWIAPLMQHNIALMSIGFFTDTEQAIVWRGPMASKALGQMVKDVDWPELDYLFIDFPPGTGDIHLSMLALTPLDGVILISTPQKMALIDARKGLQMFQLPTLKTPIFGMVENMSGNAGWGQDGVRNLAGNQSINFLGALPMVPALSQACDEGKLYKFLSEHPDVAQYFSAILGKLPTQK